MSLPPDLHNDDATPSGVYIPALLSFSSYLGVPFFSLFSWVGCGGCCCHCGPSDVFCFGFLVALWQCTSFAVVAITHSWPSRGCGPSCQPIGQSSSKTSSADCKPGPNKSIHCSPPTSRSLLSNTIIAGAHTNFYISPSALTISWEKRESTTRKVISKKV
jgi:hypothetical protein